MKQITRDEAEKIFQSLNPLDTRVEQNNRELRISFAFENDLSITVVYNTQDHAEAFFSNNPIQPEGTPLSDLLK